MESFRVLNTQNTPLATGWVTVLGNTNKSILFLSKYFVKYPIWAIMIHDGSITKKK